MRSSLRSAHRPLLATAATIAAVAMLTGGASAAFAAPTDAEPTAYAVGAAESDSRASSITDPLAHIAADAVAALDDAHAALTAARAVEDDVTDSGLTVPGDATVDTTALSDLIDKLEDYQLTPLMLLPRVVTDTVSATDQVSSATADLSRRLDQAAAEKAAADKAAAAAAAAELARVKAETEAKVAAEKAAAEQAAAEKAAAEKAAAENAAAENAAARPATGSPASAPSVNVNVDPASAQGIARSMAAAQYGWGDDQFACLVSLWNRESGWNAAAYNASSGAYGIPQALPGSKMASAGADWQTNPATQIAWGMSYIAGRYGTPCGAWGHAQSVGWY